jgi:hypothetical protein
MWLLICAGVLIEHWISEADEAPSRQHQVDSLRAEQTRLVR